MATYGDNRMALSETTCRDWFRRFNDDNFDLSDKKRENRPRKVEDCQLQALLDEDDTNRKKCLPSNWVFLKQPFPCGYMPWGRFKRSENGCRMNWTIYRWRRQNTCQILLARQKRKSFLHRIVTGDEKWIYFQNPKRKKSWIDPVQSSTSSSRPNRFGRKTMLCVWWDQENVIYYELLKPGETVNAHR